jgi:YidC/Oxa1 family membrane protein insertase
MKPRLEEIKRCYRGQERYYYIRTLHRQYGYSAFKSLIPVLSLLLQIPFFIAAYQFLEHFEPLEGQRFLGIQDLSAPDGLLGSVNLLPIVMTIVNVITAYFYTRRGDGAERKQMLVVAGIFLVVLYRFPAGLVLYWTMNNVFSFFRLFITNPEVFRKVKPSGKQKAPALLRIGSHYRKMLPNLHVLFIVLTVLAIASQVAWALEHTFEHIFLRLVAAIAVSTLICALVPLVYPAIQKLRKVIDTINIEPHIFFSIYFLAGYFFVSGQTYFSENNPALLTISLVLLLIGEGAGSVYFIRSAGTTNRLLYRLAALFLLLLFLVQAINVSVFLSGKPAAINAFSMHIDFAESQLSHIIFPGIAFLVITLPFYFRHKGIQLVSNAIPSWSLYLLSSGYLLGYSILWDPLIVYSSFPEIFNFSGLELMGKNLPVFFLLLLLATLLFAVIPRRFRWLLNVLALTMVIVSFIHNTIVPIDTGTLQENRFEKEQALVVSPYLYILEGAGIIALFLFFLRMIKRQYSKQIIIGLVLLNVLIISQSFYHAVTSKSFTRDETLTRKSRHALSFSKTHNNIIYVIPDMFQGWAIHRMMNENPELKEQLDGFVWYPNTLSVSRVTNTSVGPLIGGHAYAPDLLDLDKEHTIQEKLSKAMMDLSLEIRKQGYSFTSTRVPYVHMEEQYYDNFLPDWHDDWDAYNKQLGIRVTEESNYALLCYNALFFSAPLALKPKIYNNGEWLFMKKKSEGRNISTSLKHQFLRLLPYISDADSEKGNFIMIYSMVSHFPWSIVNENGAMIHGVSPYENNKWILETLNSWFSWMKENGVYDNTKIIIVSDHGTHWERFNRELDIDNPFTNIDEENIPLKYMLNLNPLLMVKDFHSSEPFTDDWRFMSNMDAPDILLGKNDPTKGSPPESRTLPAFVSWWTQDMNNRTQFSLEHKYIVKDSIFDGNNWTMVWDKHKGIIKTEYTNQRLGE